MAAVSTIGLGRTWAKPGIKHTLQFQIVLHLGLYHLFKLSDAVHSESFYLPQPASSTQVSLVLYWKVIVGDWHQ